MNGVRVIDVSAPAGLRLPQGCFEATSFLIEENGSRAAHLALAAGTPRDGSLVRIASACLTGEVFGCDRCDCAAQLRIALESIAGEGHGLVTYHPTDEGYGRGLHAKIARFAHEDATPAPVNSHRSEHDARTFAAGALIVAHFGLRSIRLLSANERKRSALRDVGIEAEMISPPS